ncbi:hypothetical protein [Neobacillus sp. PS2-9]|uniref:hypothetical protein n=1 Tax=Neobacillus sp. PS2-9 TaxID=3070676 RepID=UPI0027E08DFA|nr:hypothetical protein [Neobacillus sp. PS2-9]WML58687.1 hypothetical protein RCG25_02520 [Neobacillus sp. PS2-9]
MGDKKKCQKCNSFPCGCPIKIEHSININRTGLLRDEIVQLFSYTQSMDRMSILTPVEHTLLSLDVTTTELGQRVKLDSMAVIQYITNTGGTSYSLAGQYFLYRDGILISFVDITFNESKPENIMIREDLYPNLTWVDVPPTAGTHRYELRIRLESGNIEILDALTRSLNAMVFRQAI